jgi:hypothetical protein
LLRVAFQLLLISAADRLFEQVQQAGAAEHDRQQN